MPSICISSLLYTLADKSPADNHYCRIFILWLTQLLKVGNLQSTDALYFFIDRRSLQHLETNSILPNLLTALPCKHQIFTIPPPTSLFEGMNWKFETPDYQQDIYAYCDIDILIIRPIHELVDQMQNDTIYVHAEGSIHDANYGAHLSNETLRQLPQGFPGFSCGKFFIRGKHLRDRLYLIFKSIVDTSAPYYCMEQPFYNTAVLALAQEGCVDWTTLVDKAWVATTQDEIDKDVTILLDFAGEPGNGALHFEHMFDAYCLLHCDRLT